MATKAKPPLQIVTPAAGPNPDGLAHQALRAQRRPEDRRTGDTEAEFAPDPAATPRRVSARTRAAKKTSRPAAKRSAATDEGAESRSDD